MKIFRIKDNKYDRRFKNNYKEMISLEELKIVNSEIILVDTNKPIDMYFRDLNEFYSCLGNLKRLYLRNSRMMIIHIPQNVEYISFDYNSILSIDTVDLNELFKRNNIEKNNSGDCANWLV